MRDSLYLFLIAGVLAISSTLEASEVICLKPRPAIRSGSPTCWVRFREGERFVCLSREDWTEWLRESEPIPLCGNWPGKWSAFSPPQNDLSPEPKRIIFSFSATGLPIVPEISKKGNLTWRVLHRIEGIRERTDSLLSHKDALGIVRKLLLDSHVSGTPAGILRVLGFVHLLAATGIHLYALSVWVHEVFYSLAVLLILSPSIALTCARITSILVWAFAWVLCGLRPGMLRPWLVVCLRSVSKRLGLKWNTFSPLVVALAADLGVAVVRSFVLGQTGAWAPGRWIYALAVGGGLMAGEANPLTLAIGSWLPAAAWDAWHGHLIAVATPLLSLVTIPLFSLVIYPAGLLSWLLSEAGFMELAQFIADGAGSLSTSTVSFLGNGILSLRMVWVLSHSGILAGLLLASLAAVYRLHNKSVKIRLAVALLVGVAAFLLRVLNDGYPMHIVAYHIEQLDVGQGDSALIRTGGGAGLIDAGPIQALNEEGWLELLAQREVTRLDWVALTHFDADHVGGVHRLARLMGIRCVVASRLEWESERGERLARMLRGNGIHAGDWDSSCVPYPTLAPLVGVKKNNGNMGALWIPIRRGGAYLSAGDAEGEDEVRIGRWGARLFVQREGAGGGGPRILKISHHGSTTSSSPEFLNLVRPTEAWISAGIGNRYGHPAPKTLSLLERLKIPVRRTDRDGVIAARQLEQ